MLIYSVAVTPVFILTLNLFKQNKPKIIEKLKWEFLTEILKILRLCIHHIHSKETNKNANRKQSFFKNINVPCRVCLHKTQSYV